MVVFTAAVLFAGCATQTSVPASSAVGPPCKSTDLPSCEAGLANALREGESATAWVKGYIDARKDAHGASDRWVALWEQMAKSGRGSSMVLTDEANAKAMEDGVRAAIAKLGGPDRIATAASLPLPPTRGGTRAEVLLAMAREAGVEQIAWVEGESVVRVLGADAFAPLVYDFPPIIIEPIGTKGGAPHELIARGLHFDHLVNRALAHASAGEYRDAAAIAIQLSNSLGHEPPTGATELRATLLVARARLFGTEFPKSEEETDAATKPAIWELGDARQGAYAGWLRVLLATSDTNKAWAKHRPSIASAVSADRMELLDLLYGFDPTNGRQRCEVEKVPMPEHAWAGDPLFANRLAYQAKTGAITPSDWARAYDAIVTETEREGVAWAVLPSLLFERGELPGMSARGSRGYERVTKLAVGHLRALERFQKTAPDKYAPGGQLTLAMQPGALTDPVIAEVLLRLVSDNVKYKLAPAATAEELLETSLVLGFMGVMLPDPIRGAYLGSVRKGLGDKLRSSFQKEAGWDVAALYALDTLGAFLLGETPDLRFAGDNITRALESDPNIKVRPIATIAARGVHYGTLIAGGELQPERVGNANLGPKRKAARDRLEASLRNMADDPSAVPQATTRHLATLIDGLIATSVLVIQKSPEDKSADKCKEEASSRLLPEVQSNLRALRASRDALLRDPVIRAGKTPWAKRAALLTVVASDVFDALSAPSTGAPSFAVPADRAREMIAGAIAEWTSPETAAGVASLHAIGRLVATTEGDWQEVIDDHRDDLAKVLVGTAGLIGADEGSGLSRFVLAEGAKVLTAGDASSVSGSAPKIVALANTLFAGNQQDQATIALLVAGAIGGDDPGVLRDAEQLASRRKSSAAWYLAARRAVRGTTSTTPLDADLLERGLRSMTDDACKVAQVEPLIQVGRAVRHHGRGENKNATDILDGVLARAESDGLSLPRVQYQLDEVLESGRVLRVNMHLSAGQGFIAENSFSLGFDVFSSNLRSGLKVEIPSLVADDAGRYYAHVASLNAVYHLLDGRDGAGARDAERVFNSLMGGVRLGADTVIPADRSRWVSDLTTTTYVAAELASRRGHMLLAGDLWGLLNGLTERRAEGEPFVAPKAGWDRDQAPVGLRSSAIDGIEPAVKESRTIMERAATCDPKQKRTPPGNIETCEAFRHAIAMWRAEVYDAAPAMKAGAKEACVREAALLETLQELKSTQPLPPRVQDKIANVISTTAKHGYLYDALVLLRYARDRGLCIPALVEEARKIGRRSDVTPQGRVDWIGYTLTCPGRQADDSVWEDLETLAAASNRIADREVPYRIHTAVVRYMVNLSAWTRLAKFSRDPSFVRLMNQGGPSGAAMSLLLQHASDVLAGEKPNLDGTQDDYDIACIRYGNAGREQVCRELGTMRNRIAREPGVDLRPHAEQLIRQIVGQ